MKDIFPHGAVYLIEPQFKEENLKSLVRDAEYLDENNLSFEIVMMDWKSFKNTIKESEHEIDRVETELDDVFGYESVLHLNGIEESIEIHQTTFDFEYELRSKECNYGFRNIECKECGRKELFFDQKARMYYCPACES